MKLKQRQTTFKLMLALGSLGLGGTIKPAGAQAGAEKIVASVNGEPILMSEFVERIQRIKAQDFIVSTNPLQVRSATAGVLTLDTLINEKLIVQWGTKTKDLPSELEIDAEAERQKQSPPVLALLQNGSMSDSQLRNELKVQLTRFNLATVAVEVTPQEMEAYYKKNPQTFTVPERWGLSSIRMSTLAKANAASADLKKGMAFGVVVKTYSEEPVSRAKDGQLGVVSALDPAIPLKAKEAIRILKVGEVTPPLALELVDPNTKKKGVFYFIFRLTSREAAQVQPFAAVQQQLKRALALEKAGGMTVADKKIAEYRQTSKIEINLPGYTDLLPKKP